MFRDIINTIGARYLVAFLNLLLIAVNGKVLGREGMGMAGLIYASAGLAVMFNSILCGNTIVYFMNRYNLRYVFFPACVWATAGSAAACGAMHLCGMLPEGYEATVFILATLTSLVTANSLMLLGRDCVKAFNRIFILQGLSTFALLLCIYFIAGYGNIAGYVAGLLIASFTACAYSFLQLIPHLSKRKNSPVHASPRQVLREMFLYGLWSGADNLAENLALRLNYFLVRNAG